MLKLERLELSGFKSFVDPVEVRFAGGVTGIVGPNGCGKSNLSDAITWVLGEQSARSLRGEKMEDVIFSGSDARKPNAAAEVRLMLAGVPVSVQSGAGSGEELIDESFPPGSDFLATLCVDWEAEAHAASALGCRVAIVRAGVVLARDGSILKRMVVPFKFFVGGPYTRISQPDRYSTAAAISKSCFPTVGSATVAVIELSQSRFPAPSYLSVKK